MYLKTSCDTMFNYISNEHLLNKKDDNLIESKIKLKKDMYYDFKDLVFYKDYDYPLFSYVSNFKCFSGESFKIIQTHLRPYDRSTFPPYCWLDGYCLEIKIRSIFL